MFQYHQQQGIIYNHNIRSYISPIQGPTFHYPTFYYVVLIVVVAVLIVVDVAVVDVAVDVVVAAVLFIIYRSLL